MCMYVYIDTHMQRPCTSPRIVVVCLCARVSVSVSVPVCPLHMRASKHTHNGVQDPILRCRLLRCQQQQKVTPVVEKGDSITRVDSVTDSVTRIHSATKEESASKEEEEEEGGGGTIYK